MGYYGKHYERFDDSKTKRIIWVDVDCVVIKGSICILKNYEGEAQLSLFVTEPSLQRLGIGTQLMQKEMDFFKEKGYRHIFLWTIEICESALYLHDKFEFRRPDTKPNDTWARYLTEELWEYFG